MGGGKVRIRPRRATSDHSASGGVDRDSPFPSTHLQDLLTRVRANPPWPPPFAEGESDDECDTWQEVWDSDFDPPLGAKPSRDASLTVVTRALSVEIERSVYKELWPSGSRRLRTDRIRDWQFLRFAAATLPKSPSSSGFRIAELVDVTHRAIGVLEQKLSINRLNSDLAFSTTENASARLTAWLNKHHRIDGVLVWHLAPVARRLLGGLPGPSWYFHWIDLLARARFHQPHLDFEDAAELPSLDPPDNFGWEPLEGWALHCYLANDLGEWDRSTERLEALVDFAVQRIQMLQRGSLRDKRRALTFHDLCRGLRHSLFWYAAHPRTPANERLLGQKLLRSIDDALQPRRPTREPVVLDESHLREYEKLLAAVREVWQHTRDYGLEDQRREELSNRVAILHDLRLKVDEAVATPLDTTRDLLVRERRLWRECGDLRHAKSSHVARCILKLAFDIDLQSDAIRKALSKVVVEERIDEDPPAEPWPDLTLPPPFRRLD